MQEITITHIQGVEDQRTIPPKPIRVAVDSPNGPLVLIIPRTVAAQLMANLKQCALGYDSPSE